MIIDVNASLGHYPFRKLRFNTAEKMIGLMDRNGVERSNSARHFFSAWSRSMPKTF